MKHEVDIHSFDFSLVGISGFLLPMSLECLSPLTHTKIYLSSTTAKSTLLRRNARRFVPNSVSFRVPRNGTLWGEFDLLGGLRLNKRVCSGDGFRKRGGVNAATGGEGSDSGEKSGEGEKGSNRRREKQGKGWWSWLGSIGEKWRWQPIVQAQEVGVLVLQLGIVIFVMRLLRPGIPLPGSEPRAATAFVSVPYSEFLSRINSDQVQKVEVDGVHIMFKLKTDVGSVGGGEVASSGRLQAESESLVKSVAPTKRVVYTTTRPSDIRTPYEKMLENEVEFGSPDKRSGGFFNSALVSKLHFV